MLRARVSTVVRPLVVRRTFACSSRVMAEGDTGSSRSGGAAQGDAFTKREKANEDYFIQNEERNKLLALREKIRNSQKHLEELDSYIDEATKGKGEKK